MSFQTLLYKIYPWVSIFAFMVIGVTFYQGATQQQGVWEQLSLMSKHNMAAWLVCFTYLLVALTSGSLIGRNNKKMELPIGIRFSYRIIIILSIMLSLDEVSEISYIFKGMRDFISNHKVIQGVWITVWCVWGYRILSQLIDFVYKVSEGNQSERKGVRRSFLIIMYGSISAIILMYLPKYFPLAPPTQLFFNAITECLELIVIMAFIRVNYGLMSQLKT